MMRALTLALLLTASPVIAQNAAIGVNAAIRNVVTMKTTADERARPAVLRESVHLGDAIVSGPASQLQVLLRDRSVFTVGANARMTIDKFVYDPARATGDVAASVAKGAFRFMSGRTLSRTGGSAAVRTPVASIGVRGTIVEGVVGEDAIIAAAGEPGIVGADPETASLIVLRGPGKMTDGLDKPGAIDVTAGGVTVTIDKPGYAVIVPGAGKPPVGPFLLSASAFEKMGELLRTQPTAGERDDGPIEIASAAVASGEILSTANFGAHVVFDPVFTDFPVLPSDKLGVPCDPGGGSDGGTGGGGGRFCPF